MKTKTNKLLTLAAVVIASFFVSTVFTFADWTAPVSDPPTCNSGDPGCDAPITTGPGQIKDGGLAVATYEEYQGAITNGFLVRYGNVGIGTLSPQVKLDVAGQIRSTDVTSLPTSGTGLELYYTGSTGVLLSTDRAAGLYKPLSIYGNPIELRGQVGGGLGIHVENDGNVGIGVTAPTSKLHVFGGGIALGEGAIASGQGSFAGGWGNPRASGLGSFAFGYSAKALNTSAIALGFGANATGVESLAYGRGMTVSGSRSIGFSLNDTVYNVTQPNVMAIMNGKVGIGDVDPFSKLTVRGTFAPGDAWNPLVYVNANASGVTTVPGSGVVGVQSQTVTSATGPSNYGYAFYGTVSSTNDASIQQVYGARIDLTTHPTDVGYGVYITKTGASTGGTQYGIFDLGADRNYFSGNVGIGSGSTNPSQKLDINGALRLQPQASAPALPSNGVMYYDNTLNKFRCYQGGGWADCIGSGGSPPPASVIDNNENVRMIRGSIRNESGTPQVKGSGFTYTHTPGTGVWVINFNTPFSDIPTVVASTPVTLASCVATWDQFNSTAASARILVNVPPATACDVGVSFIIIGPQ